MTRVDIIYFDVTSGHRSAAQALASALGAHDPQLRPRLLNFTDVLAPQPFLRALAQAGIDAFNWQMRREQAYLARQQIGLFQWLQGRLPAALVRQIARSWAGAPPAVVVSVMPICNLLLERALHAAHPACPYLIIPVDFEEPHAGYWFDRRIDAAYLTPDSTLAAQAAVSGVAPERLRAVRGMPIDPLFYAPPQERAPALAALGLDPALPTVLVGFGGQGSVLVRQCAEELIAYGPDLNVILLCGRDAALRASVAALATPYRKLALGFTPAPPAHYYHLADVVVGKPGTMTITEALITRTALLAIEARALAVVQRGNEAWLRRAGVGEVIRMHELPAAVARVLATGALREPIAHAWHRGVFEMAAAIAELAQGIWPRPAHAPELGI